MNSAETKLLELISGFSKVSILENKPFIHAITQGSLKIPMLTA
jgi:hypothetical protein